MDAATTPTHQLRAVVDGVRDCLDEVASSPLWSLPEAELGPMLAELVRERVRLDALILDLVRQADVNAVHTETGAASTAVWVRPQTRMSRTEAGGAVKLAKALDTTLHTTKQALAEGRVSLRHAQEIHLAMGKLPADIDPVVKARGEAALVEQAQTFDPQELRALGERLYQVVPPDDADRRIGEQLAREERKAAATRTVYFGTAGPGIGTVTMRFERAYVSQLHGMLDALAKPRPGPHGRDTRPYDRRLADAAIEWIGLAQAAGNAPTGVARSRASPRRSPSSTYATSTATASFTPPSTPPQPSTPIAPAPTRAPGAARTRSAAERVWAAVPIVRTAAAGMAAVRRSERSGRCRVGSRSRRGGCGCSPATPRSSPRCWEATAPSSTSAPQPASSPATNATPSANGTDTTATSPAAKHPKSGATHITSSTTTGTYA